MIPEPPAHWEALIDAAPQRIIVTGANGAGKTRLGVALAEHLGLPVLHNDAFALLDNWRKRPSHQSTEMRHRAVQADEWVLEGGPSVLAPEVLERAELVIWLDRSAGLRMWRILSRTGEYMGRDRPEHPPGNPENPGARQTGFVLSAARKSRWFRRVVRGRLKDCALPVIHIRRRRDAVRLEKLLNH